MRGLRRPGVTPPTLRLEGKGGKTMVGHRKQRACDSTCTLEFPNYWTKAEVRGALYAMQGWVCAYCQREIHPRDLGDIDHFRPKNGSSAAGHSGYWWLAYNFDNYLLSCAACNEFLKLEKFPIHGSARANEDHADPESNEHRLLIDPARDGERLEKCFQVDVASELCFVQARAGSSDTVMCDRINETIRQFALNEDMDLLRDRARARQEVIAKRGTKHVHALGVRANRYHAHSATWRDALQEYAPWVSLPTLVQEFEWLRECLRERLDMAARYTIQMKREPEQWRRRADEALWTLAYLWVDPPAGTADDMKRWLDDNNLTAPVAERANKLRVL